MAAPEEWLSKVLRTVRRAVSGASRTPPPYRTYKGGLDSKLHDVCDPLGRPITLCAGQVSDHRGAAVVLDELPRTSHLIADLAYDSAWFRQALWDKGIYQ